MTYLPTLRSGYSFLVKLLPVLVVLFPEDPIRPVPADAGSRGSGLLSMGSLVAVISDLD